MQTSLYGASKLAGEGLIQAYCEGFGFQALDLPLRLDSRRALHARPRVRFLPEPARRPDALARARQRQAAQVVPLRAGLHRRDSPRAGSSDGQGQRLQPRHRRVLRGERLDRLDHRSTSACRRRSTTRAATAAGSATTRSSFSTRPGFARSAGRRSSRSARASCARSTTCKRIPSCFEMRAMKVAVLGLWHSDR